MTTTEPRSSAPDPRVDSGGGAVAAFVLAILSYLILPVVLAIVALVLASRAKHRAREQGVEVANPGLLTAARILSWINIVLVVVGGILIAVLLIATQTDTAPKAKISETPVATSPSSSVDGNYTAQKGSDTFVGYRANEVVFGREGTPTGRTGEVTGTLAVSGTTVDGVKITAALSGLSTGEPRRDSRARAALATDRFPEATFTLTEPIQLAGAPEAGVTVSATATGDLTIKGTTKRVQIPIKGRWDGTRVQVVGSLPIKFSDYGVDVGSFAPVAEVQDNGTMEFQIPFVKT